MEFADFCDCGAVLLDGDVHDVGLIGLLQLLLNWDKRWFVLSTMLE